MHLVKDFGFLCEDIEVINATSSGNNILFKKCVTPLKVEFEEQLTDYITDQPSVSKSDKQIDEIKFICNHFRDLPDLQNLFLLRYKYYRYFVYNSTTMFTHIY